MPAAKTAKPTMTGLLIGYARVSTDGQDLVNQRSTLRDVGCTGIPALAGLNRASPASRWASIPVPRTRSTPTFGNRPASSSA